MRRTSHSTYMASPNHEAALTGRVECQDRGEVNVHILAAYVDATPGELESHQRHSFRVGETRVFEKRDIEGFAVFRELEPGSVIETLQRVPAFDVLLDAGAEALEHDGRRAFGMRGDPLELVWCVVGCHRRSL